MKLIGAVLVAALMPLAVAKAQTRTPELEVVSGVTLHLGMTKAEVAEKLIGRDVQKISDDEWMIGSREQMMSGPDLT